MILAPNFELDEFLRSSSYPELAAKPTDLRPEALINMARLVWSVLVPLRERFGPVLITSGYRSRALNEKVHGAHDSAHLSGCACDFYFKTFPARGAWEIVSTGQVKATWDRLAWYPNEKRFHVDIAESGAEGRGLLYIAESGGWVKA